MNRTEALPMRAIQPTIVTNSHGARFLLIGYDQVDALEVARLVDSSGCEVSIPVDGFRAHFTILDEKTAP